LRYAPRLGTGGFEVTNGINVVGWTLRALLIPLATLASGAVWAADDDSTRWSLGMQLGQARGHMNSDFVQSSDSDSELSPLSYDMAATVGGSNRFGWRVFTGYRFTDFLAAHVGYTDLGESQTRLVATSVAFAPMDDFERVASHRVRGVDVGLQVKLPVTERISVDVHGGKYYWRSNTDVVAGEWGEGYRGESSTRNSDSDDFFGAGMEVAVMHDLSATVSWTRYQVGSDPVSLWTIGALYRFGFY
jgi:hypothetical protein